ncbi:MAG: hypothetical protein D6812_11920 [Deltaproteobacteria bacterium]|nr:MAG: hypothetical protein D6812_11920 [Deltaproteobacteria bacterium]
MGDWVGDRSGGKVQEVPFCADVRAQKTHPIYKAHSYHTKVPHEAIIPYIEHYTDVGDVVLDGFCGSGMVGVAAGLCGRRAVLSDLSPVASFIAANYTRGVDVDAFVEAARDLLDRVRRDLGWMYRTEDGGWIDYTVWSEVFGCPSCGAEIVFADVGLGADGKIAKVVECSGCGVKAQKRDLRKLFDRQGRMRLEPVLINCGGEYRRVGAKDRELLRLVEEAIEIPEGVPKGRMPLEKMARGSRLRARGMTHVHHLFLPRPLRALGALWQEARRFGGQRRVRNMLLFLVEQAIPGMSLLNRYSPTHYSQVNRALAGTYYVGSLIAEVNPWYILEGKLSRLEKVFRGLQGMESVAVSCGDCGDLPLPDESVDYIFTDPPFGGAIDYFGLNFLTESWHGVMTREEAEAVVRAGSKEVGDFERSLSRCFMEYYRVLKKGRWISVVFSCTGDIGVWHALQRAIAGAGFSVVSVRCLDRGSRTFNQSAGHSVSQDLVISARKVEGRRQELWETGVEVVWDFVETYLKSCPVSWDGGFIVDRAPQMIYDRMVGFCIRNGILVPISAKEFFKELKNYEERRASEVLSEDASAGSSEREARGGADDHGLLVVGKGQDRRSEDIGRGS